ncbi:unnamed protein product [Peronospora belbahrii]|uniref:Uncharacterized protein n=1 Tax=Peronospora belbahrii TaxID=622444 RepID=A0AAU9KW66_9STRA|nr:unnamed protein product [Peronospora belbahrii]
MKGLAFTEFDHYNVILNCRDGISLCRTLYMRRATVMDGCSTSSLCNLSCRIWNSDTDSLSPFRCRLTCLKDTLTHVASTSSLILFQLNGDRAEDYMLDKFKEDKEKEGLLEKMVIPSPLRTPKLVGNCNEIDMVYDYSDKDDIIVDITSPPTVTKNTALLLLKAKTAEKLDLERQQRLQDADDDEEGYMTHLDAKCLCFRTKHVPYLLFLSDFIVNNGAGMTINFFPL